MRSRHWGEARLALVAVVLTVIGTRASIAADLRNVLTDYTLASWSEKDGLPAGTIWALEQDPEGYLWVGSSAGLFRFDGLKFVPHDLGTAGRAGSVRALHVARGGTLWVGLAGSRGVVRIDAGAVHTYAAIDGLVSGVVNAIAQDATGAVWAGTDRGLFRFDGKRWEEKGAALGLPNSAVFAAHVDDQTGIFVVTTPDGVYRLDDTDRTFKRVQLLTEPARGVSADSSGRVWVTDPIVGYQSLDRRGGVSSERGRGVRVLHDRVGSLWIGTGGQGLWRVPAERTSAALTVEKTTSLTGLLADGVYALFEDRDGNIWAGTTEGLNRLTPRRISQIVDLGLVRGIETPGDGSLWVATVDGLVRLSGSGGRERAPQLLSGGRLQAIHAGDDGTIWAATERALVQFANGAPGRVLATHSLERIEAIGAPPGGRLWLHDSDEGIVRLVDGRLVSVPLPAGLGGSQITLAWSDRAGALWVGFTGGRLARLDPRGKVKAIDVEDATTLGAFRSAYEDENGVLWFGSGGGLTKLGHGTARTLLGRDGFPLQGVTAIVGDGMGSLWLATVAGIMRLHRTEFDRAVTDPSYKVHFNLYRRVDGVAGLPLTVGGNRRAVRTPDGRLWFVTVRGITIIDPAALEPTIAHESLRIDRVVADDKEIAARSGAELPPGTRTLQFDYAVLDLTSPLRARFRYRLEGFDRDWVDAGTRRQAFYTNLPPQPYRFHVVTSDQEGAWAEPGVAWAFSIEPMFYQMPWFYASSAAVLGLTVLGAWRLRVSQMRRHFALLVGERARLSREIHDTLLQSMVGIALRCDVVAGDAASPRPIDREELVSMRKLMEEHIREARQAIWDLRSPTLQRTDLAGALRDVGEQLFEPPTVFELAVQGVPRRCQARIEEQLFRIGQEALLNAAHHAAATRVSVELAYDASTITLRVSDNGCGFDPSRTPCEEHYGLTSMGERAEQLGARLAVDSAPGGGTRVSVVARAAGGDLHHG